MADMAIRLHQALDATERLARLVEYPGHGGSQLLLRTIVAHRKILARHVRGVIADYECGQCGDPWPCGDLRALAEAYGVEA